MAKRNVNGIAVIAALIAILIAAAGLLTQVYAESPAGVSDISIQVTSRPLAKLTWDKQDCDGYTVFRNSKDIHLIRAHAKFPAKFIKAFLLLLFYGF